MLTFAQVPERGLAAKAALTDVSVHFSAAKATDT